MIQGSTKYSPFHLLFGRPPRLTTQRLVLLKDGDGEADSEADGGGHGNGEADAGDDSEADASDSSDNASDGNDNHGDSGAVASEDRGARRSGGAGSAATHTRTGIHRDGRVLAQVLATRINLGCGRRREYLCRWATAEGDEGEYPDTWMPARTLGATDAQMRAWIARSQRGAAVLDAGEFASSGCDAELLADDAVRDALAEEAAAASVGDDEAGVAAPLRPYEASVEVYAAEADLPFQISAWRDAARERGATSAQAKQLYAGILESLREAQAAKATAAC